MKLINLVYEYEYDDVDIILVPDYVYYNIERIVQEFYNYVASTDEHGWFVISEIDGEKVLATDTAEFVQWLNKNYAYLENKPIVVIAEHTKYNPNYPMADF